MNVNEPVQPDQPCALSSGNIPPENIPPENIRDRYQIFLDETIANVLKGQFRSKEQIYQHLVSHLEPRTGEIFERVFLEQAQRIQQQLAAETDEFKNAKLTRQDRAVKTLQQAWEQWQNNYQIADACATALKQILQAEPSERLLVLLETLDPNQNQVFDRQHIQQLAQSLKSAVTELDEVESPQIQSFALGLKQGLASLTRLEAYLVSWLFETQNAIGFESTKTAAKGPWQTWAKHVNSPLPQLLFTGQAENRSAAEIPLNHKPFEISAWVELIVLLQGLLYGLVKWLDQQPYSFQAGRHLAGESFIVFAMLGSELSNGFQQTSQILAADRQSLSQAYFRMTLQILRTFAQRENFPLYGGVFASFAGESFRETLSYLDQPLKAVENIQEKARILTVLAFTQARQGNIAQAMQLYQEALTLARQVDDRRCEIASLNHLSRLSLTQLDYERAIAEAQRALILARQSGDLQGEGNAIANLGFSTVMVTRQQELVALEDLEIAISYLQQGQQRSEKFNDLPTQALCCLGLGSAYLAIAQPISAQPLLVLGLAISQQMGDSALQAQIQKELGEAYYQLQQIELAIFHSCLGMYQLSQHQNPKWKSAAALMTILQGQQGEDGFNKILQQLHSQFIALIGIDGFDYIPNLIHQYRNG